MRRVRDPIALPLSSFLAIIQNKSKKTVPLGHHQGEGVSMRTERSPSGLRGLRPVSKKKKKIKTVFIALWALSRTHGFHTHRQFPFKDAANLVRERPISVELSEPSN